MTTVHRAHLLLSAPAPCPTSPSARRAAAHRGALRKRKGLPPRALTGGSDGESAAATERFLREKHRGHPGACSVASSPEKTVLSECSMREHGVSADSETANEAPPEQLAAPIWALLAGAGLIPPRSPQMCRSARWRRNDCRASSASQHLSGAKGASLPS